MPAPLHTLTVPLQERSYDIVVGTDLLYHIGAYIKEGLGIRHCVVITDHFVSTLYLERVQESMREVGHRLSPPIIVTPGEGVKNFSTLESMTHTLLSYQIDRSCVVVALGGGVIGDVAGLVAAITLRGLPLIHSPTTLLAQVDSAIGGKTGINTHLGKNLVGVFYQPYLVLSDIQTLHTLPLRHIKAGYAEILKYALISDKTFFVWLESYAHAVLRLEIPSLSYALYKSCKTKLNSVALDEYETQQHRALLNLGHTFAHALETLSGYSETLLHGEAVAMGLGLAFRLSERLGFISKDTTRRVYRHLVDVGLPVFSNTIRENLSPQDILRCIRRDKKACHGHVNFILVEDIGRAKVQHNIDPKDVLGVLGEWLTDEYHHLVMQE